MKFQKGLYYLFYIPTLFIASVFVITLGQFMTMRMRLTIATLWNRFVSLSLLRITTGIKVEIEGRENIPKQVFVAVSNHQSEWETLHLCYLLNPINSVLKKELLRIPFFGWALWGSGHIGIDRSNARGSIKRIETQGLKRLQKGVNILIFPEGTRVEAGGFRRFTRTGAKLAIDAGVPLLPIAHTASNCWSPSGGFQKGTIKVVVGEPIDTAGRDPKSLTNQAEKWIRETANLATEKPPIKA
jgi:1-acyl-sn-glycerol-3-phosphate acyltransferase